MEKEVETTLNIDEEEFDEVFIDKTYMFFSTPLRLLVLLGGTVLISLLYKGIIEIGFFKLIKNAGMHRIVYCLFELLLLVGFWHGVFMFSKECKHRSHSLGAHYLMIGIVSVFYTGICCVLYHFLNREMYSWLFRITLNLCGLRFKTSFPKNLTPYLIAYLIITILIMLLEPPIAKRRFDRFVRQMEGIPSPLRVKIDEFLDPIYERRFERDLEREMRRKQKKKRNDQKEGERFRKREEKWKMKMRKRREKEKQKAMKKNG